MGRWWGGRAMGGRVVVPGFLLAGLLLTGAPNALAQQASPVELTRIR